MFATLLPHTARQILSPEFERAPPLRLSSSASVAQRADLTDPFLVAWGKEGECADSANLDASTACFGEAIPRFLSSRRDTQQHVPSRRIAIDLRSVAGWDCAGVVASLRIVRSLASRCRRDQLRLAGAAGILAAALVTSQVPEESWAADVVRSEALALLDGTVQPQSNQRSNIVEGAVRSTAALIEGYTPIELHAADPEPPLTALAPAGEVVQSREGPVLLISRSSLPVTHASDRHTDTEFAAVDRAPLPIVSNSQSHLGSGAAKGKSKLKAARKDPWARQTYDASRTRHSAPPSWRPRPDVAGRRVVAKHTSSIESPNAAVERLLHMN